MIVKFFNLKENLKDNINFYLLYGSNSGLIEETTNNILKPNFSKNIFTYDENEILSYQDEFKESIFSKSFFDKDKLVIINRASDKILNLINEIIDKKIEDLIIIIKSGVLEKKSKLRKFFETDKNVIIVPFYEDNYQSLSIIAQNFFKKKKISISTQNINYIVERAKGNRLNYIGVSKIMPKHRFLNQYVTGPQALKKEPSGKSCRPLILEQVSAAGRFSPQIALIVLVGWEGMRHTFAHMDTAGLQTRHLLRVVGHQIDPVEAKNLKHTRRWKENPLIGVETKLLIGVDSIEAVVL